MSIDTNPWMMHYNAEIFGDGAAKFRPERWIEDVKGPTSLMEQNFHLVADMTPSE